MIECQWRKKQRLLFNIDGQVYPCCYLVNSNWGQTNDQYVMKEYNKVKNEMNVFTNDIDSINNHQWWDLLEKSWEDADIPTLTECNKWCTVKEKNNGSI